LKMKLNPTINKWLRATAFITGILFAGCHPGDFGDLNVNPNEPSEANTAALLTGAETRLPGDIITQSTIISSAYANEYVQFLSDKQYTENSRYSTIGFDYGPIYTGPLDNLRLIIQLNSDSSTSLAAAQYGSNQNQIAAATILQSYLFLHLTDRFGDIPFTEALQGRENFKPTFTPQQQIYDSLFVRLKRASDMIDESSTIQGDILFNGEMRRWKIFANTTRMVMALRISEVDATRGKEEFNAAIADGVISSNAENVQYNYVADNNNDNPWEDAFETRLDYTISQPLADTLNSLDDPRIAVYANKATATGTYVGMPYGITESEAGAIPNAEVSFLGDALRAQTAPTYIYTYSQVLFSLAEAARRGWIEGGEARAADYYNQGIRASWEQYGVLDETALNTYLSNPKVAYNSAIGLQQIALQKWISLFLNGYEAWAEWRRLDYPILNPAPASMNPGGIPRRQGYPSFEATLNKANYDAAVSSQGADNLDTPVWWDK
jgi:hypothetical protein